MKITSALLSEMILHWLHENEKQWSLTHPLRSHFQRTVGNNILITPHGFGEVHRNGSDLFRHTPTWSKYFPYHKFPIVASRFRAFHFPVGRVQVWAYSLQDTRRCRKYASHFSINDT
ncbi:hypothetical protein NPIL_367541 [Nephila pilipes]|uniref:Uncharacterized protein n=1 Tax=Nephila pilipes TaxID=299642 RepID=A0A8X6N2H5_NEPPI|nr:hypothetical protein NPIL_367541 [Nephila pilipes]